MPVKTRFYLASTLLLAAFWTSNLLAATDRGMTAEEMHLKRQQNLKKANELFLLGKQYFQSGEYEAADRTYKQAQALLDENANLTDYEQPVMPQLEPQPSAAVQAKAGLPKPPKPDKRKADQLYNQALEFLRERKFTEAEKTLQEVLVYSPKDKEAIYNLAVLYDNHLNKPELAVLYYRRYLKLDPWADDAYLVQGWIEEISKKLSGK